MSASAVGALVLSPWSLGCSFAIDGPRLGRPKSELPRCDTGKGLLVIDVITGAITGLAALTLLSEDETGAGLAFGAVSGLSFLAVSTGNSAANRCRAAFVDYEDHMASLEESERRPKRARAVVSAKATQPKPGAAPATAAAPTPRPAAPPPTLPTAARPAAPPPATPTAGRPAATPPATPTAGRPAATPPATPTAPARPVVPPTSPSDDDPWAEFWREVP